MNFRIAALAAIALIAVTTTAEARHRHHGHHRVAPQSQRGDYGCAYSNGPVVVCLGTQKIAQSRPNGKGETRISAGGCPHTLGCGCNLANYFHITGRKWRELWVARNWAHEGSPTHHGCTGCVAVLSRGRGGHVGIVKSYDANGNPVIYSYANGRLGWTTAAYPKHRVIAYREI